MSNIEVIKPEGEQSQPRTWQEDIESHNADYSRPEDKRLSSGARLVERAGHQTN
ncbi:hypothetical protein [Citrobacter freundii]|uniref:hypothetical protein n=1 Tax=Citrobacter freundii TaxID=546 RepID=UPI003AAB3603